MTGNNRRYTRRKSKLRCVHSSDWADSGTICRSLLWCPLQHAHDADEKPPPCGLDPHIVPQERTVKAPDTEQEQNSLQIRRTKKELVRRGRREENRRRENERRLEGQRREFERKCEARKKAKEEAAASTAACTVGDADDAARAETRSKGKPGEHSKRGKPRPRQRNEEAPLVQPQPQGEERKMKLGGPGRSKGRKKPEVSAKADDQKVDTENDPAELLPGLDADAAYLTNTDGEEHSLSPLMARVGISLPPWVNETDHQPNIPL